MCLPKRLAMLAFFTLTGPHGALNPLAREKDGRDRLVQRNPKSRCSLKTQDRFVLGKSQRDRRPAPKTTATIQELLQTELTTNLNLSIVMPHIVGILNDR